MTKELIIDDLIFDVVHSGAIDLNETNFYLFSNLNSNSCPEYSHQKYTFKYGNYDALDLIYSLIVKSENYYK